MFLWFLRLKIHMLPGATLGHANLVTVKFELWMHWMKWCIEKTVILDVFNLSGNTSVSFQGCFTGVAYMLKWCRNDVSQRRKLKIRVSYEILTWTWIQLFRIRLIMNWLYIHKLLPVTVCLKYPGCTTFTSTLFTATICWKLLLLGSQLINADVAVMCEAFTHVGARGKSENRYSVTQNLKHKERETNW